MYLARRGGPRTPSRTTDANLDCTFVENTIVFIDSKIRKAKVYHPTPPDVASKLLMRLEVVAPDITHSEFAPLFLSGGSIQLSVPLPCRMRHMKKVQQRFRNGFRSIADVANFHKISAEGRKIKKAQ